MTAKQFATITVNNQEYFKDIIRYNNIGIKQRKPHIKFASHSETHKRRIWHVLNVSFKAATH